MEDRDTPWPCEPPLLWPSDPRLLWQDTPEHRSVWVRNSSEAQGRCLGSGEPSRSCHRPRTCDDCV